MELTAWSSQTWHCEALDLDKWTCSTNLQYVSGSLSPHVAFTNIFALVARFNTGGDIPPVVKPVTF